MECTNSLVVIQTLPWHNYARKPDDHVLEVKREQCRDVGDKNYARAPLSVSNPLAIIARDLICAHH